MIIRLFLVLSFLTTPAMADVWDSTLGKGIIQYIQKFNDHQKSVANRQKQLEAIEAKKQKSEEKTKVQPPITVDGRRAVAAQVATKFDWKKAKRDLEFQWAQEDAAIADMTSKIISGVNSAHNGGTAVAQLYTRAKSLAGMTRSIDDQSYTELLDGLTADYMLTPNHRDAIFILVNGMSEQIQEQLLAYDEDPVVAYYLQGAAWSWLAVAYFEFRGWKNIKEVGKGAFSDAKVILQSSASGAKSLTGRLRGNASSAAAADESAGLTSQQAKDKLTFRQRWESLKTATKTNFSREAFGKKLTDTREALQDYWARRGQITKEGMVHLGKSLTSYARQLALAQVGGAAYSLRGWNIRYEPRKVDPLFLLRNIQGGTILELHADVIDMKNTLRNDLKVFFPTTSFIQGKANLAEIKKQRAKWMGVPGKSKGLLAQKRADVEKLRTQYNHFVHMAPRYLANVPNVNILDPRFIKNASIMSELLSIDGWFRARVHNNEEAQTQFLQRAAKLNDALNEFDEHINNVKGAYWDPNKPIANVSLVPIGGQIGTLESWLRIFEENVAEIDLVTAMSKKK